MLKIKRLKESAIIPTRAYPTDAGLDLYATETVLLASGEVRMLSTGIAMEIPEGYEVQIRPRSGLSKKGVVVTLGTVDSDYRGEVKVTVINQSAHDYVINYTDRIAQAVIARVELWTPVEVDELSDTDRGGKGFGSSGV